MLTKLEQKEINGIIKYKLVENILVKPYHMKKVNFTEQISFGKENYKALAIFTFAVSKPDAINSNERRYTSKLWENVISKQMGEGCYALVGHPTGEDGNPKDAFAVTHHLRFNENRTLILADYYLFGPHGRHALEAIECGGQIGISTSGFGSFKSDNVTIEESSYELERIGDWVLEPSSGMFGTLDYRVKESKDYSKGKNILTEKDKKLLKNMDEENNRRLAPIFENKEKRLIEKSAYMLKKIQEKNRKQKKCKNKKSMVERILSDRKDWV